MMRRLLATTALAGCLLSAPAEAGPAIPLVAALAPALAAAGVSSIAVAAISIGLSVAAALLTPKPKTPGQIGDGRTHQVRQAVTHRRIILGMAKVSGPLVFWHTRGNKSRDNILHEVIPLAGHPIAAFLEHYRAAQEARMRRITAMVKTQLDDLRRKGRPNVSHGWDGPGVGWRFWRSREGLYHRECSGLVSLRRQRGIDEDLIRELAAVARVHADLSEPELIELVRRRDNFQQHYRLEKVLGYDRDDSYELVRAADR